MKSIIADTLGSFVREMRMAVHPRNMALVESMATGEARDHDIFYSRKNEPILSIWEKLRYRTHPHNKSLKCNA